MQKRTESIHAYTSGMFVYFEMTIATRKIKTELEYYDHLFKVRNDQEILQLSKYNQFSHSYSLLDYPISNDINLKSESKISLPKKTKNRRL